MAATTDLASVMLVPMMPVGPRRAHPLQYMPATPGTLPLDAKSRKYVSEHISALQHTVQ